MVFILAFRANFVYNNFTGAIKRKIITKTFLTLNDITLVLKLVYCIYYCKLFCNCSKWNILHHISDLLESLHFLCNV